ncbi:MAG: aldehyde dehydrogenase family protein [Pirellulales bacterium]
MSLATGPLTRARLSGTSLRDEIDRAVAELQTAKIAWADMPLAGRIQLAVQCLDGVAEVAGDWVAAACLAKGIAADSPLAGEEIANGPLATVRYLRLLIGTLQSLHVEGAVRLPAAPTEGPSGQLQIPVLPCAGMFDSLLFRGFKAHVWMQRHVTRANLREHTASYYRAQPPRQAGVSLVLGAGNVSSIAPTDALYRLFHEGRVVLLKMNPVNDHLGEIFARAFRQLVQGGYLRFAYGGAEAGAYAAQHPAIDDVHITGSSQTHDSIVWGADSAERAQRKAADDPLLKKPITSELGNVTPWIIVPGPYTDRELDFQAENLAASIVNNASFNCIASKLIVTQRGWPAREKFLAKLQAVLDRTPPRAAYYPGAPERFCRFVPDGQSHDLPGREGTLPWTIVRDVSPSEDPQYFREESFVCVTAETALVASSAEEFLDSVPDFCNERIVGTLGATLVVHPKFRRAAGNEARLWRAVERLRYGTVAINHWSALGYAIMSAPWGGYSGGTLADPTSGIGWVHNTFMLDGVEKTVLEGPLTVRPKPFWFPSHRTADKLAWQVTDLYHRPSALKLPRLFWTALRG